MVCLGPLVPVLYFGLLPELDAMANPPQPGRIRFTQERPTLDTVTATTAASTPGRSLRQSSLDWFHERFEEFQGWEHNPWRTERVTFGRRYFDLLGSKDPRDQALAKELQRLGDALHKKVLARYPELAPAERKVAPERNGFLRWLEFSERIDADPARPGTEGAKTLGLPRELSLLLSGDAPWDEAAVRAWLTKERSVIDEVRAIGLLPEQSVAGIDVDRYGFISARLAKEATEALLLEARVAAADGDAAAALESVRAARGLADHLGHVETPTLLAATVQILVNLQTQAYVLSEILPALPAGQRDAAAWESALSPEVSGPAEFARLMHGEWNVTARHYLLPMLSDAADPEYPPDPEALIDYHAGNFVRVIDANRSTSPADWPAAGWPNIPETGHLSRQSADVMEMLFVGANAWSKGLQRAQSQAALTQAVFTLMKGQPLANDPVYGQPYRWDPATRTLSTPDTPEFQAMGLKPVVVPHP